MRRFLNPATLVLLLVLAYMAISGGRFSDPLGWLMRVLYTLPGIIVAITCHEFAHAFSAYKLGDQTPKIQGRVSLNPLRHLDPFGLLCIIFIGFGWGKPVMVNPLGFRHRRRDEIIVSLAGVTTNLFLAVIFCGLCSFFLYSGTFSNVLYFAAYINIILMVFNLIPVPPLDGFNVLTELLHIKYTETYYKIYNNGMWILMLLIVFGVAGAILDNTVPHIFTFLFGLFMW